MSRKMQVAGVAVFTAAAVAGYTVYNHLYWHRLLPNRLFKQLRPKLVEPRFTTGGWITMAPEAALVDGKILASYRGGVTTADAIYRFHVAETGKLLSLHRTER